MTDHQASLAAALAELQTQLPEIKKDKQAEVTMKTGQKYSYAYADLYGVSREVLPLLGRLGLSFTARPTLNDQGKFVLSYELLHVSGDHRVGEYPLPDSGSPQALGSAITYGRRYCLCAVTGVAAEEEDDGAQATAEAKPRTAQRATARRDTRTARQPGPPLPGEQQRERTLQDLQIKFTKTGIARREEKLAVCAAVTGRELESSKDLAPAEIGKIWDKLNDLATRDDVIAFLARRAQSRDEASPVPPAGEQAAALEAAGPPVPAGGGSPAPAAPPPDAAGAGPSKLTADGGAPS